MANAGLIRRLINAKFFEEDRLWNIENVFKEQKYSGFGLKHRFVNATNANRSGIS